MGKPNVNVAVGGHKTNYTAKYKAVILKNNLPFAAQVTEEGRIYVIKYDFDLNGEVVSMPKNCVLDFEGGSISNGKVVSNNTEIIGVIPENNNSFYGVFYHDGNPLNYNLKVTKPCSTGVFFAFMAGGAFVDYRFYPQGVAAFYYNDKKYHLLTGNIEGTSPERAFIILLDENYDYLGSTEISYAGHGGGLAVCDDKLYMACNKNQNAQYPEKYGIAVYDLSNVIFTCTNEGKERHSDVYTTKIQSDDYISLQYDCVGIDYDNINEEFAVIDGGAEVHICDKNFEEKRSLHTQHQTYISDAIKSKALWQGAVLKNGILYGTVWTSDWPAIDRGNNLFYVYDTIADKIISYEKLSNPYQNAECEGLFKDPDDDNNLYFLLGSNLDVDNEIIAICKVSQVNSIYGLDAKRENSPAVVNSVRSTFFNVNVDYDYSKGPSNGSSIRPFKTLDSAIACAFSSGVEFLIYIRSASKEYFLPKVRLGNACLNIVGIDCTPTINGSIWAYGGAVRLQNLNFIAAQNPALYASNKGFLYMGNSNLTGNTNQAGIQVADCSNVKLENVTISDFANGIISNHSTVRGATVTFNNCLRGMTIRYTNFGCEAVVFNNCSLVAEIRRTLLNLGTISISNADTGFVIDDSFIHTWAPRAITISNVRTFISKDTDFRGRVNIMCGVGTSEDLAAVFDLIKNTELNATTIGFNVHTHGISYNGISVPKGTYIYNNPGFIRDSSQYLAINETIIEGVKVFSVIPSVGTSLQRPFEDNQVINIYDGFEYIDTTLKRPIYFINRRWVFSDGSYVNSENNEN